MGTLRAQAVRYAVSRGVPLPSHHPVLRGCATIAQRLVQMSDPTLSSHRTLPASQAFELVRRTRLVLTIGGCRPRTRVLHVQYTAWTIGHRARAKRMAMGRTTTMTALQRQHRPSRPPQTGDLLCPRSSPTARHHVPRHPSNLRILFVPDIPLSVLPITRPIILQMVCPTSEYHRPRLVQALVFPRRYQIQPSAPHHRNLRRFQQVPTAHDPAKPLVGLLCRPSAPAPSGRPPKGAPRLVQQGQDRGAHRQSGLASRLASP